MWMQKQPLKCTTGGLTILKDWLSQCQVVCVYASEDKVEKEVVGELKCRQGRVQAVEPRVVDRRKLQDRQCAGRVLQDSACSEVVSTESLDPNALTGWVLAGAGRCCAV